MRRISTKLTVAAAIAIALVMSVHAYSRLEREAETFRSDMLRDHRVLGHALAETTGLLFDLAGPEEALHAVEEADRRRGHVQIRWLTTAEEVESTREAEVDGEAFLVTRVPVETTAGAVGAIQLRESLAPLDDYAGETMWRVGTTTIYTVLVCAMLVHLAGWLVLDRRLRKLVDAIRRMGRGELEPTLPVEGDDELGFLAGELDEMRKRLGELQRTAAAESDARLSALEQLRHADRLSTVGKLAAGVAHELGTPLNVVAARAKMIRTGESEPEEIPDDARVIGEQAERMTRIIRQVLDFARPRAPERAEHDLRVLASSVLGMLRPQATKAGVELRIDDGHPVLASVDAGQIQQVVTNLVMNAIQAQPDGGEVTVSVGDEAGHARLEIRDRGPGLTEAVRDRIFEPFFTTKDVGEGTGLGLSVVHGIVQEHGGTIRVSEADGGGAAFVVELPR